MLRILVEKICQHSEEAMKTVQTTAAELNKDGKAKEKLSIVFDAAVTGFTIAVSYLLLSNQKTKYDHPSHKKKTDHKIASTWKTTY